MYRYLSLATSGPRVSESVVLLLHRVEFDVRYF